jgi:DNA replication terminus site-binding protein
MASYDLVERLNDTFRQIELELQALRQALTTCRLLAGRVFELPAVSKDAEHDPLANITVVQHTGKAALDLALRHYSHLFIQQQSETAAAKPPSACRALSACRSPPRNSRICWRAFSISTP